MARNKAHHLLTLFGDIHQTLRVIQITGNTLLLFNLFRGLEMFRALLMVFIMQLKHQLVELL
ncbi:Uncharacterised protein [Vibrio cholerae]|nr:Uncharacterised protein [Vibrio cholerae]CRZ63952.1 Uncharacterised protein [Vibrio cholerae]CSB76092.1 Uncharacterised protein [Vibrio cholerae]CSB99597.1 Uncharacterised protein [Vibrio cholerae]